MPYYSSGTPAMTRPTLAYFYDEWGMPLSSEPIYTAGPGHAAKIKAEMDAKIAKEKENAYLRDPNKAVLSPGDAASAADAQSQRFGQQQDQMYNMIMAMLGGSGGSTSGGGWTPGSTLVGGMGGGFGGGMGGGMPSGDYTPPAGVGGPGNYIRDDGAAPAGYQAGQGMTGTKPSAQAAFLTNGQRMSTQPGGLATSGPTGNRNAAAIRLARQAMTNRHEGPAASVARMMQNRTRADMRAASANTMSNQAAQQQANITGRPVNVGVNGVTINPSRGNDIAGGGKSTGGGMPTPGGGSGGGSGMPFGQAFEQSLYSAFSNPGFDPEPIINRGTEEIASGESNALVQLQNRAANQGIEGGAVQAGNREVLSDFAGKRANLARDVRVEAAKDAEDKRMSALNAAGGYLGRISDNARQDRNQMIQLMMQQMQNQQNRAPDYSSLISQAGNSTNFAPILAPGGGKPGSGASGGSTFPGQFQSGLGQAAPVSSGSFSALWGPGSQSTGVSRGGGAVYDPSGVGASYGLQANFHNTGRQQQAAQGRAMRGSQRNDRPGLR